MDTARINTTNLNNVLVIEFRAPALTEQVFEELNSALDSIDDKVTGVIFTSSLDSKIFLAGADLYHLSRLIESNDRDGLRAVLETGQRTFKRIENLAVPTVTTMHGACLGGGFELSLACNYRVASNDKCTKIGLPEVTLGILPAWGGSTRLPELLPLPKALNVILTGKQFAAKPALKLGLVDKVTHKENMISAACEAIEQRKCLNRKAPRNWIPASIVFNRAKASVAIKTRGNYPAPLRIIKMLKKGQQTNRRERFKLERDTFMTLCQTPEMNNLLRIFLLQEKCKKLTVSKSITSSPTGVPFPKVKDVCVVGAGIMGSGIAQWTSSRGINVLLKDVTNKSISRGLSHIGKLYVDGVHAHAFDRPTARGGIARVYTATEDVPLDGKDVVIEAIVEKLDVKKKLLSELEHRAHKDTIIATNTSALSVSEMSRCLECPDRFVGVHFFNPVHKMKLVEVVKGEHTSDITLERAVKFVQQIGKLPVVVNDSPGFVVNRILVPYLIKAADFVSEGYDIIDIDNAMVKFGMPMGPIRLMDEIGLDTCYHVASDLIDKFDHLNSNLEELSYRIHDHKLGKKTGEGFYIYKNGKAVRGKSKHSARELAHELVNTMVCEAHRVIDEGVIGDPDMLDFAMIMGTGWAPFRGGPIRHDSFSKNFAEAQRHEPLNKT